MRNCEVALRCSCSECACIKGGGLGEVIVLIGDEEKRSCTKLHNEDMRGLYSPQNIIDLT
jgi:hypothetical protein